MTECNIRGKKRKEKKFCTRNKNKEFL